MNYIYYNRTENEWTPATLEELAMLNEPNLPVCELNPDGTPGPQTTYAALENLSRQPRPIPAPPAQQPFTPNKQQETPAERDRRYSYFLVRICCSLIAATFIFRFFTASKENFITNFALVSLITLALLAISHDYKKK